MKTYVNPKMLEWARSRCGFSVDSLAKELKKSTSEITEWENGTKSPSYTTLEKLAYQYFKVPLAIFFFPDPPHLDDPKTKMRRLPDYELSRLSPDTFQKISLGQAYQESVIALLGKEMSSKAIFKDIETISIDSIIKLAKIARDYIGISVQEQISFNKFDGAFKRWRHRIENAGIFTFKDSFEDKFISGFSLFHENYPIIFINNSNAFSRQIFTLIHELGHILFGVNGISDIDDKYLEMMYGVEKDIEIKCNKFAAEFLIPSDIIRKELYNQNINEIFISDLSKKYSVSREVILRRCLDNGKISNAEYISYTTKWKNDYLRNKKEKDGGSYYLTKLSYLGEGYTKIAYSNYKTGKISAVDLGQHLNMNSRYLSKLEGYLKQ
jgi:Zn-dependent peptidase ImmA (M78 family)/DNA-binding XRE family transcriptional regulator